MIRKLYPNGRKKAFNITYDDGVLQDVRFVQLLNRYGLKGTFNLNSELMEQQFEWVHPCGMTVKRLSAEKAAELYKGHEVASHTLCHPYMENLSRSETLWQLGKDRENLQRIFGWDIAGFAVPFSYYSQLISDCAKDCGFEYARCSEERYSYTPPEDYYWWAAGSYHINPKFRQFAEGFFDADEELALCQIVGHSYDLDAENMWEYMEDWLGRISRDKDIISLTNKELVRYLKAMRSAVITPNSIENTSSIPLWFEVDGKVVAVQPYTSFYFE